MNERNYVFLCDQLRYSGFDIALSSPLKEHISAGEEAFQLDFSRTFDQDETTGSLHFRKSGRSDLYFFVRFAVSLFSGYLQQRISQSFPVYKDRHYTLREAYNLLSGRAVHKSIPDSRGTRHEAWVQLDFSRTDRWGNYKFNYFYAYHGFDLHREIEKYPLLELENPEEKDRLIASLYKGERRPVTVVRGPAAATCFLEANPQYKTVRIFDAASKRLDNEALVIHPATEQVPAPASALPPPLASPPPEKKEGAAGRKPRPRPAKKEKKS